MPNKPKYNYCILTIEKFENEGLTINEIARKMEWSMSGTHAWINRNFKRLVFYVPIKRPVSRG